MQNVNFPIEGVVYPSLERSIKSRANGSWIDSTVGNCLRHTAAMHPDKLALVSDEGTVSYRELNELTERLGAALLSIGLMPGDRAIFQLATNIETVIVLMACFKAGIVPVCSLPQHREVEIGQLTKQTGARGYFVQADISKFDQVAFARQMQSRFNSLEHIVVVRGKSAGLLDIDTLIGNMNLEQAREILQQINLGAEDVLAFQLSGGTTGMPKVIPRFHAEYLGQSAGMMSSYGIDEHCKLIWSLPLLHNAAQLYVIMPLAFLGLTVVLMPKIDIRRMLELIEKHKVTHGLSIGPIAPQLLAYTDVDKHDLSSLKLFSSMSRADKLEKHLKVPCANQFGITEGLLLGSAPSASVFIRHETHGPSTCKHDEILLLTPETELPVQLGEVGELCFRGPSSLTGFFNMPEANEAAFTSEGFYRTGDMMTAHLVEGQLCYTFEGRLRDNVNRGGEKIGCEEVEGFVSRHPAISDAKLVAMPDPHYGEKGCVFVVLRPGKIAPDVKALAAFLVEQGLAKYKCPERIELIESFPLTRVGKVDKLALKQLISKTLEAESKSADMRS